MRAKSDKSKIEAFMSAVGKQVRGRGRIYLTGGATAVLHGWRPMTIDIDIKPDPEPAGLFEVIASVKEQLDVNVELASPDQFIPAIPGWRERSLFIALHGFVEFFHYDPYGQALAKLQRGHARDLLDVQSLLGHGLIQSSQVSDFFHAIEPQLIRYPAINATSFRDTVTQFCHDYR